MTLFAGQGNFYGFYPPPGKNINQNGKGRLNFDHGTRRNDMFNQSGVANMNIGLGGRGADSFSMGGIFNRNFASGGNGSDFFEMGGGLFNKNIADGGNGADFFHIKNDGFCNESFINGGDGTDNILLDGRESDYLSFEDENGTHYRHKLTGNVIHMQNVENVAFSQPELFFNYPMTQFGNNYGNMNTNIPNFFTAILQFLNISQPDYLF